MWHVFKANRWLCVVSNEYMCYAAWGTECVKNGMESMLKEVVAACFFFFSPSCAQSFTLSERRHELSESGWPVVVWMCVMSKIRSDMTGIQLWYSVVPKWKLLINYHWLLYRYFVSILGRSLMRCTVHMPEYRAWFAYTSRLTGYLALHRPADTFCSRSLNTEDVWINTNTYKATFSAVC